MAWHDCKLWISALFCLHSEVFHWSRFRWVRFAHSKEECPKPRYYLLFGCTEGAFWGEIFFKVLEFLSLIHCFVRLDIDLWKFFEDVAIGMIFLALIMLLKGVSVSQVYEYVSVVINICQEEEQMLFFLWQLSWSQCWCSCLQHVILETDYSEDSLFSFKSFEVLIAIYSWFSCLEIMASNPDMKQRRVQP